MKVRTITGVVIFTGSLIVPVSCDQRNPAALDMVEHQADPDLATAIQQNDVNRRHLEASLGEQLGNLDRSGSHDLELAARRVKCYKWGCRFEVSHATIAAMSDAWKQGGATKAVRTFIVALGATGWAATVAPYVIPAYFVLMKWADRMGGYRGVYVYVTWALVVVVTQR